MSPKNVTLSPRDFKAGIDDLNWFLGVYKKTKDLDVHHDVLRDMAYMLQELTAQVQLARNSVSRRIGAEVRRGARKSNPATPMPIEVGDVLTVRIEDGWGTKLVKRKAAKVTKKFVTLHDGYTKFRRYPTQTEDALSEVDGIGWIESVNGVPTAGWESGYDPDPRKARRR